MEGGAGMRVLVKKTNENAVIPYKTHNSDFCYDVVATSCEEIAPNVFKYGIGLAFEIDRTEFEDLFVGQYAIDFRPRSSVWKTGLVLSNCTGTIDEDYRGEVSAIFYKVAPGEIYKVGDRIGQIKINSTLPMEFEEVEELSQTNRGSGSYGSTGK